jgi:hypothetical protein
MRAPASRPVPALRPLALCLSLALLGACTGSAPASDTPPGPAAADVDATWTVRIQGNDAGEMTVRQYADYSTENKRRLYFKW